MRIELNPDWSEFLRLLLSHHVRFVLVGGHAVAGHGEPRLTEDLDVFVDVSPENSSRIRASLVEFGLGDVVPTEAALLVTIDRCPVGSLDNVVNGNIDSASCS